MNQGFIEFVQEHRTVMAIAVLSLLAKLSLPLWDKKRSRERRSDRTGNGTPSETMPVPVIVYRVSYVPRAADIPKICQGCAYVCGDRSNNQTLICAIHPYGPKEGTCPDFEPSEPCEDA